MQDPRRTQQQTGDSFDFRTAGRSQVERMISQGRFGSAGDSLARVTTDRHTRGAVLATSAALSFWLAPMVLARKRRRRKTPPAPRA